MDPAGVFATSFARDQSLIRTRKQLICLILFMVLLAVLPLLVGPQPGSGGDLGTDYGRGDCRPADLHRLWRPDQSR